MKSSNKQRIKFHHTPGDMSPKSKALVKCHVKLLRSRVRAVLTERFRQHLSDEDLQ